MWVPHYLLSSPEQEGTSAAVPGWAGLPAWGSVAKQGEQHELNVSNLLLAGGFWHTGTAGEQGCLQPVPSAQQQQVPHPSSCNGP